MRNRSYCAVIASNRINHLLDASLESIIRNNPDQIILVNDSGISYSAPLDVEVLDTIGNTGLSNARNIAIDKVRTDYIVFCDDDDVWAEDKLDSIDMHLKDDDLKFIIHDSTVHDLKEGVNQEDITRARFDRYRVFGRWIWMNYLAYSMPISNSSCWCIRRDIFNKFQFNREVERGVDGSFWYHYLNYYREAPVWIEKSLTLYGVNHGSERITSNSPASRERKHVGDAINRKQLNLLYFFPTLLCWWIKDFFDI